MFQPKLTTSDQIIFFKQLAFILQAGVSIPEALKIVSLQSRNAIKPILNDIQNYIHRGKSLSESLTLFPSSFAISTIKILEAGEISGLLKENIQYVANELLRKKKLQQKIISSCIYPFLIAIGTVALSFFLIFFIFPKVRSVFKGLHVSLPLSTRIVIWFSDMSTHYWYILLSICFIIPILWVYSFKKFPQTKEYCDILLLRIPFVSKIIKAYFLSQICKTLGTMLRVHIPIQKAIEFSTHSITHTSYARALTTTQKIVHSGQRLSESFKQFPELFPFMTLQIISSGEKSGTLDDTLLYLSELYDQELEEQLKILTNSIEPLLMITMGFIVGFISLSIITPIYEITQNLH